MRAGDAPVSGFVMNDLLVMQDEDPVLVVEATSGITII